jgi:hypothetical protein
MKNSKTIFTTVLLLLFLGAAAAQTSTTRPSTQMEATLINTDPAPIQSGEDADITFKIRNTGNIDAENVQVQLLDTFPFEVKPDRKVNYSLGDLTPGQEYQISTEVLVADNAPDGQNSFEARISHGDFSITKEIPIQVQSQDIELNLANLKTTPSTLTPDTEDAKITLEVVNNGEKTAENTVVNIGLPENFEDTSSFSTRQALGNIRAGEVKRAEFRFDVNKEAESGDVAIPTNITYITDSDEATSRITESADFSFNLAPRPQFEVEDYESDLQVGSPNREIRVTVRNIGGETSEATRIRVLDSSDQPFSYTSSSQYIGTLEPNQTGTAVFTVGTESGAAAKDYLVDFEIRGVDDTKVYTEDTTFKLPVENGEQTGSGLPVIPLVVILAVAGSAAYYFREQIRNKISGGE